MNAAELEDDMDKNIKCQLEYLKLTNLQRNWDTYLKQATAKKCSYHNLLEKIIADEHECLSQKRRAARIKAARIPEPLTIETFPFQRQPQLKKKLVMELYDSMRFMTESQMLCFFGPTGCGKSGLGTSYLIHAINKEYRGLCIDFKELLSTLYASLADHSYNRALRKITAIDCLLIDEVGYCSLDKEKAGIFFDLIKARHRKRCTIITSQFGFEEWTTFINDRHLTAAILDRITENCTVFNMSKCISLRRKRITYATEKNS
jgi:DNA replication protein DnaC